MKCKISYIQGYAYFSETYLEHGRTDPVFEFSKIECIFIRVNVFCYYSKNEVQIWENVTLRKHEII